MSYRDFVNKEFREKNWMQVAENFREVNGKNVLIFTHEDPDGLAAGCMLKRLFEMMGGRVRVELPRTYELEESRLDDELSNNHYYMVVIADKGTMGYYDDYVNKAEKIVVIDHHPLQGERLEKILVMNPQLHGDYKSCSTSFLVHMLMTYFEKDEKYDDFLALAGLKGDWAVEPATEVVSDYVKDFYNERVIGTFDGLVKKVVSRPTMFEVSQREKTTLLNQTAELYFALGGGGFGYFYNNRHEKLKDISQPGFSFDIMEKQREKFNFNSWNSLEDFIDDTENPEIVNLIFNFFKDDWENTNRSFSGSTLLTKLGGTDVYFFLGRGVSLMPMAGSVYLNELKKESAGREVLFIMVNTEMSGNVHFSIRGTADEVHCGKICGNLAERLVAKYGHKDQITGGGHPFAAECRTRSSGVRLSQALEVFTKLITDMEEAD